MLSIDIFFDSNIIVEGLKGNKIATQIIARLKTISTKRIFINEVVWSETVYQLCIKRGLDKSKIFSFLNSFFFLTIKEDVINYAENLIAKYNLAPNDALILSTCKYYSIGYLVSLDKDFKKACKDDVIILINSPEMLSEILETS
jgi:predicted nucleic acid-binding protein